ncbi:MAG: FAD-dependent oxidoreductase [Saprospirales bacterium]|nr:FAD-dependent oxidoreductase [Saprospirales bacterium]
MNPLSTYDFLIIGGGLFGAYSALYLAEKGYRSCILEKEAALFRKASIVNQARLHGGYHYPRSIATARMSDDHRERFTEDHKDFVNFEFEQYYAIEKYGSLTDAAQFERFCKYMNIRCERVMDHPLFDYSRLEALYLTTEYSFDAILIARHYVERLKTEPLIEVRMQQELLQAETEGDHWRVQVRDHSREETTEIQAPIVINATYAGSNAINRLFGGAEIELMHEISEMAFVAAPKIQHLGLTVMDGPFGSIMPYGKSGLLSVSSVAYTHHRVSYENLPNFPCQTPETGCRPGYLADCNPCIERPPSNYRKMLSQMGQYFSDEVEWQYFFSYFTIKSKLQASFIDDSRPTEISLLRENPHFYCIFAGKINSIYEIEKVV